MQTRDVPPGLFAEPLGPPPARVARRPGDGGARSISRPGSPGPDGAGPGRRADRRGGPAPHAAGFARTSESPGGGPERRAGRLARIALACTFLGGDGAALERGTATAGPVAAGATVRAELIYDGWPRARRVACQRAGP